MGYTFTTAPISDDAGFYAINDEGVAVGFEVSGDTDLGVIDDHGTIRTLQVDHQATFIDGINNGGILVGTYGSGDSHADNHGFVDIYGQILKIDVPGAVGTEANAINDSGEVVGDYYAKDGTSHGFTFIQGVYRTVDVPGASNTAITGVDDRGDLIGDTFAAHGQQPQGFLDHDGHITTIDFPGSDQTHLTAINNKGQVLGTYTDAAGNDHGFIFDDGHYKTVDGPASVYTEVEGLNIHGDIVGYDYQNHVQKAFIGRPSGHAATTQRYTYTSLPTPTNGARALFGVNDSGEAVGFQYLNGKTEGLVVAGGHVTTLTHGALSIIATGVNDAGTIVGNAVDYETSAGGAPSESGFIVKNGVFSTLAITGATQVTINAISNSGEIVGGYTDASGDSFAFTDIDGKISKFGVPGGDNVLASGVNSKGVVVGTAQYDGETSGFIADDGTVKVIHVAGSGVTELNAINDKGDILGTYSDASGTHPFILQPNGTFVSPSLPTNVSSLTLSDINDKGVLVGFDYSLQNVQTAVIATPAGGGPLNGLAISQTLLGAGGSLSQAAADATAHHQALMMNT